MPFIGGLPRPLQAMALEAVRSWPVEDIYVGCSGNFGLERALAAAGKTFHSNDVSMYTCAIGSCLTGQPFTLSVADDTYAWLGPFLGTSSGAATLDTVATLLLCTSLLRGYGKTADYWVRHVEGYRRHFAELHAATKTKAEKALDGLGVEYFYPGDVLEHIAAAPPEAAVLTFPPTYKGGYERAYKSMEKVLSWPERPSYRMFDEQSARELRDMLTSRPYWLLFNDQLVDELEGYRVGVAFPSLRKRPVYCYGSLGRPRLSRARELTQDPKLKRLPREVEITSASKLRLLKLKAPAFRWLRDELLAKGIIPATPQFLFAVMLDGYLLGLLGLGHNTMPQVMSSLYMMCDVAVPTSRYRRLSKLVLAASLSRELLLLLSDGGMVARAKTMGTTAFTDKPVSMKYRGIYKLQARKEGRLHYVGDLGRWTLQEGLEWWLKTQSASTN